MGSRAAPVAVVDSGRCGTGRWIRRGFVAVCMCAKRSVNAFAAGLTRPVSFFDPRMGMLPGPNLGFYSPAIVRFHGADSRMLQRASVSTKIPWTGEAPLAICGLLVQPFPLRGPPGVSRYGLSPSLHKLLCLAFCNASMASSLPHLLQESCNVGGSVDVVPLMPNSRRGVCWLCATQCVPAPSRFYSGL